MEKKGVLLVNLGSPASPSVNDVQKYLSEFLMDKRVIDVPYPLRRIIVKGFILPFRSKKSAEAYRLMWWKEGSPLLVISQRIQEKLIMRLDDPVVLGMRYGSPSIESAVQELLSADVNRILLIPLYPHYAISTFESSVVETRSVLRDLAPELKLDIFSPYYNHPLYVEALVQRSQSYLTQNFDHLLFSYHGLPERHLRRADPTGNHCLSAADCCETSSPAHQTCYRHQVLETTRLFVEKAAISPEKYSISFQSRLGKDTWTSPFTSDQIMKLANDGIKKLLVICPSFVTDCLETLEEIGIQGREIFLTAGGERFELIPCLNDHPAWITALQNFSESL
ncbi:MAG: ferrochelatase [Calditrichaeota bacterium]|nr:ferrochelatase [Calditrichota bacterium]RQW08639.1 MAG: ferrochelatase [Calditrichota bacterium]